MFQFNFIRFVMQTKILNVSICESCSFLTAAREYIEEQSGKEVENINELFCLDVWSTQSPPTSLIIRQQSKIRSLTVIKPSTNRLFNHTRTVHYLPTNRPLTTY